MCKNTTPQPIALDSCSNPQRTWQVWIRNKDSRIFQNLWMFHNANPYPWPNPQNWSLKNVVVNLFLECAVSTVNDMKSIFCKSKWTSWHCHVKRNKCKHVLWLKSLKLLFSDRYRWPNSLGNEFLVLFFFILIFWCFLMFFGALSPKMTLVFS